MIQKTIFVACSLVIIITALMALEVLSKALALSIIITLAVGTFTSVVVLQNNERHN
ncbi:hypothetical protein [Mangrovimonas aestuarii]|uniref:hypothetical protein n=1 Tax=Mangrovimonas aestuarii TaxID=3018443 RepID=UPI0023794545|nr:hypothetical protein [Mangrovimonas aestuarii]